LIHGAFLIRITKTSVPITKGRHPMTNWFNELRRCICSSI